MERIAFHIEIEEGKRAEYREAHENVPEYLEEAYLVSGAGVETYSVFEADGHVFGYLEVEDPEAITETMRGSEAQHRWDERMEPILDDEGATWMDEVYRMR